MTLILNWDSNKKRFIDQNNNEYTIKIFLDTFDIKLNFSEDKNIIKTLKEIALAFPYDFLLVLPFIIEKTKKKFLSQDVCEWIARFTEYDPYIIITLRRKVRKPSIKFLTNQRFVSRILYEFDK